MALIKATPDGAAAMDGEDIMAGRGGVYWTPQRSFGFSARPPVRTRPGAPLHDPTSNIPIGGLRSSSLTPQSNWDSLFKPRLAGQAQGGGATDLGTGNVVPMDGTGPDFRGVTPKEGEGPDFYSSVRPDGSFNIPGLDRGSPEDIQRNAALPSLDSMAGGGMNHAQRWSQPGTPNPLSGTGYETGDPSAIMNRYQSPVAPQAPEQNTSYGWGAAFQNPDEEA